MATKRAVKKVAAIPAEEIAEVVALSSTPKRGLFGKPISPTAAHEIMLKAVHEMRAKMSGLLDELASNVQEEQEAFIREKEGHERMMAEQKEAWRREQDNYTYERDLKRKKEEDEFALRKESAELSWRTEKTQREQMLIEKENVMRAREAEIRELEKQTREFPATMEKAVAEAVSRKETELRETARIAADMTAKDRERESELAKMRVQNLEETIKRQSTQIQTLERQLQQAVERAQALATTVVEGGTQRRADAEPRAQA